MYITRVSSTKQAHFPAHAYHAQYKKKKKARSTRTRQPSQGPRNVNKIEKGPPTVGGGGVMATPGPLVTAGYGPRSSKSRDDGGASVFVRPMTFARARQGTHAAVINYHRRQWTSQEEAEAQHTGDFRQRVCVTRERPPIALLQRARVYIAATPTRSSSSKDGHGNDDTDQKRKIMRQHAGCNQR